MPNRRDHDHIGNFNFKVEIEGVTQGAFRNVEGLDSETEIVEYQDGDDIILRKRPGRTKYSNVILKRGYINSTELWDWRKEVIDGKVAAAAAPRRSDRSAKRRASCGSPVTRAKESAVACASAVSIRTPRSGWSGSGVYEEYRRRVNRTRSPRSSITWRGRRLTR